MAQQQWASQYVSWNFNNNNLDVWNIDQQIWLPKPNINSFWPLQWSWKGIEQCGYLGLQQSDGDSLQIRFSLWNAIACRGNNCGIFSGEGTGYSCVLPITIKTDKFYKYRLWRQEIDSDGIWWGAWLIEDDNGVLIEHYVGEIKVPLSCNIVNTSSITNFVEYFGNEMDCIELPLSIVGFAPPTVNFHEGIYDSYSTYAGSDKAVENYCDLNQQHYGNGALVIAQPVDFGFANGVVMFLGGNDAQTKLTIPIPS